MKDTGDFTEAERAAIDASAEEIRTWRAASNPSTRHALVTALVKAGVRSREADRIVDKLKRQPGLYPRS